MILIIPVIEIGKCPERPIGQKVFCPFSFVFGHPLHLMRAWQRGELDRTPAWSRHSRYLRRCARWRGSLQVSRVAISEAPEMRNPTCTQTHSITPVRDDKRETSKARMMCVGLLLIFLYRKLIFLYPKGIFFLLCVCKKESRFIDSTTLGE